MRPAGVGDAPPRTQYSIFQVQLELQSRQQASETQTEAARLPADRASCWTDAALEHDLGPVFIGVVAGRGGRGQTANRSARPTAERFMAGKQITPRRAASRRAVDAVGGSVPQAWSRRARALPRHEHPPPRLRRARARAGLEDGGEPADRPALLRAGQRRHRAGGGVRGARHRRPRGGRSRSARRTRSTSSWSGPRRRWSPAWSTTWRRRASRRSARAGSRRGWKAPRASPRTCAGRTTSRPRPMSGSPRPRPRRTTSARRARRSW